MDEKCADYVIDPTANQTQNCYLKKICTLQFLVPISIISFLVSYFSVFPLYSSIFPLFAHALDRKCMFLICNGILAFLANNMKLSTSALNYYGGFMKRFDDEDGHVDHLPQMVAFQENAASMEYDGRTPFDDIDAAVSEEKVIHEVQQEQHSHDQERENIEMVRLESSEVWGEEDDDDDGDDEEIEEINAGGDDAPPVSDMRVSTEELNKKFDEFIRKMKEEIRIEARQQYVIVV